MQSAAGVARIRNSSQFALRVLETASASLAIRASRIKKVFGVMSGAVRIASVRTARVRTLGIINAGPGNY
jgi:hypothetical protein